MDHYTHLPTPEGRKAEMAQLDNQYRVTYPQSGHMPTIDREQGGKARRPKTNVLTTKLRR